MEHINWWEDETNFPCLITNGEPGCLVVINHQVDGVGYDIRDGKYFLSHETTNWRLATLEEAMCLTVIRKRRVYNEKRIWKNTKIKAGRKSRR